MVIVWLSLSSERTHNVICDKEEICASSSLVGTFRGTHINIYVYLYIYVNVYVYTCAYMQMYIINICIQMYIQIILRFPPHSTQCPTQIDAPVLCISAYSCTKWWYCFEMSHSLKMSTFYKTVHHSQNIVFSAKRTQLTSNSFGHKDL